MSNQVEQIPAEIEREMQEIAERAPSDFCHYSDIVDREEWCKEKFRHFFIAGLRAERERMASCPTIKGWVARNRFGGLGIFHGEQVPRKDKEDGFWYVLGEDYSDPSLFPDLRWEDDPIEVEIIIKSNN